MARRTATTANAILGLLTLRDSWSAWELTRQLRRNMRFFWPRAESQIFDQAKSLVTRGLARDQRAFTGRRARTSYEITAPGRQAVSEWLATAPRPTALESEPLLRVFFADLATPDQVLAAISQIRQDGNDILDTGRIVGPEYLAGTAPFQDQLHARALILDFLSHYARMLTEWSDRAEQAVTAWPTQTSRQRTDAALAMISANLAQYPARPPE
jgi:PadR family transcriptional regulator, regulatory protein AphA